MKVKEIADDYVDEVENQRDEFKILLRYINNLADHKLGYPVSLLSYLGIVDNKLLGIRPHSLANILLNNVGDPFKDSETSLMEVKQHERKLISILEKYYGLNENSIRGYVTTGGTEGNFAGLWWSKRFLINQALPDLIKHDDMVKLQTKEEQELMTMLAKIPSNDYSTRSAHLQKVIELKSKLSENKNIVQQLLTPTVFFSKNHTHYSVPKISEILHLNIRAIAPNPDGSIDLTNFKKELMLHLSAHPYSSIIMIANIGTTITGAIDDVPGIKKILDEAGSLQHYTMHMDGALTGFVLPILKPFGNVANYFEAIGVNTLAVSAHKYPGLSQPCGILLARREFFEKAFEKSERSIDYVGNILDVTITGSRSGLNVLMFYNTLRALKMDKNTDLLTKMVEENLQTAKYLYEQLVNVFGSKVVSYPYHFNILFPKPSMALAKKYQLMITGETATICVLTNVTKELIDAFIKDLQLDLQLNGKETTMTKTIVKTDYTIQTLTNKHMASAADLFIQSFCDSEPITKYLDIAYEDYEPFAMEVIQKAVKDNLSVVAVDKNNRVIACAISEDITNQFKPNLTLYPKLQPIFTLLEELSQPFFHGKKFLANKIVHVWIAIVAREYRGQGLSTEIDQACGDLAVRKGYDFAYAEFTNPISEKITHHYNIFELCNSIKYTEFTVNGKKLFQEVNGGAAAYIIGIKPGIKIDSLQKCYTSEK